MSGDLDSAGVALYTKMQLKPEILKALFISRLMKDTMVHKAYVKENLYAKKHAKELGISDKRFLEIL
ncbi:MAG: hypothetical protein ABIM42_07730 [candidate division WOR-3 bacterium]